MRTGRRCEPAGRSIESSMSVTRSTRSMSGSSESRNTAFISTPRICDSGRSSRAATSFSSVVSSAVLGCRMPMARIRSAPRWSAGLIGAFRRTPPSPYQARPICTGGKKMGIEAEAITWSSVMVVFTPIRRLRAQGAISGAPSKKVTEVPGLVVRG